jgi:hypothetical protein
MKNSLAFVFLVCTMALSACATSPVPAALTMSSPGTNGPATDLD